jgi:hypothetical protein
MVFDMFNVHCSGSEVLLPEQRISVLENDGDCITVRWTLARHRLAAAPAAPSHLPNSERRHAALPRGHRFNSSRPW